MNISRKYNIKPNKRMGQNFLTDKNVVKRIMKTAGLNKDDVVLEIGPGFGVLTKEIAKTAKKVTAVEKDKKLCEALKKELKDYNNVEIINEDVLSLGFQVISYKVVANLPFYITAPVIRKFLEAENPPKEMVLIMQKEVAQRIAAKPPKMSILAVSVQIYAEPKIISYISKNSFYPKPKVDAAILKITLCGRPGLPQNFFRIVKAGFKAPRKQLINNLSAGLGKPKQDILIWLEKNNIDPKKRAETLTINDWINLYKML